MRSLFLLVFLVWIQFGTMAQAAPIGILFGDDSNEFQIGVRITNPYAIGMTSLRLDVSEVRPDFNAPKFWSTSGIFANYPVTTTYASGFGPKLGIPVLDFGFNNLFGGNSFLMEKAGVQLSSSALPYHDLSGMIATLTFDNGAVYRGVFNPADGEEILRMTGNFTISNVPMPPPLLMLLTGLTAIVLTSWRRRPVPKKSISS